MLFAAYGAPAPPRGKNPLVIILGVCGGCVLLVIIGVVIMGALAAKTFQGVAQGAVAMAKTMPAFLQDLQSHNYSGAAALVDPSAQDTLTADKIQSMEESVEKKLGPMKKFGPSYSSQSTNQIAGSGSSGKATKIEYVYTYPVTYQKGSATATFKFLLDASGAQGGDLSKMKLSGKVTDFKLEPNGQ